MMDLTCWPFESDVGFVYLIGKHWSITSMQAVDGSGKDVLMKCRCDFFF